MIALVSPGQGSQKPGFLTPWLEEEGVKEHLERLSDASGLDIIRYGTEADEATIRNTAIAQPLIVAAGIVTGSLIKQREGFDESQVVYAGHSVGEITAAALAGVLTEEEAMKFIKVRAEGMAAAAAATPSGMSAVLGGKEDEVRAAIEDAGLTPANSNGASQIVAAGSLENLEAFAENPPARTRVIPLQVAGAFHTAFMQDAVAPLAAFAQGITPSEPVAPLLSNFDGQPVASGQAALDSLVAQVTRPVRWDLCMATLSERSIKAVVELAPAGTLVGLAKRGMKGTPGLAVNTADDLTSALEFFAK
ncbi:ACP S-malonyltransferase [Rothia sp. ZJ932]|uniref:ACP S-malonyltransferase n=1 Tax=Rothia sp. ZJ932 TaxID=2810516 RepID=UPI001968152E|nr:ACP S-malonyltransferase [Rothia sp. ZJ932]QRZ62366.1 ACP S-malonyltransferase [Rothia sp. ZJ932]